MLDLRHNGGGLLNEAVSVASVFLQDGRVVSTKGRARPEHVYNAEGGAIAPDDPGRRARRRGRRPRRRRSSPARCRTASGRRSSARARSARASSRRSSGCPTAARWTSPWASTSRRPGATSAAAACAGRGHHAGRQGDRRPEDGQGRGAADRRWRRWPAVRPAPLVGVLDSRAPGGRRRSSSAASWLNVDKPRGERARGDLVRSRPARAGAARIERRIGRPDVARDVLEALMLHRGLRRRFDPLVEREARIAAVEPSPGERRGPPRPDHVHDRPADGARLRRRDLGRGARRRRGAGVGAHRRRRGVRASPGSARRPRGVPARELGLRARPGRADAARGAVEPAPARWCPARTGWP